MVGIKFLHPSDRVTITIARYGSKPAELAIHISESDLKRLMKFGQKNQVKMTKGGAFRWKGPLRIISRAVVRTKRIAKPKPAPPIPRGTYQSERPMTAQARTPKKKRKGSGELSEYNLFVKKHRLAGKDMKQIGAMWRKKKR